MKDAIPKTRFTRALSTGKVIARMGGNQLGLIMKKPFLSSEKQQVARQQMDQKNAAILFNGLSLLRGTALKAAQFLSFESDILSAEIRKELEKSYHQVPPMNRALVRKIIRTNYQKDAEDVFRSFDPRAFAAASLGQVHGAVGRAGEFMAVKIQYPDIARTISNDIAIMKAAFRPMGQYELIRSMLDEVERVIMEETDYIKEAANIEHFSNHLSLANVILPKIYPEYSTERILAMSMLEGQMLDKWLEENPDQACKNKIAQTLHDIFLKGFYELNVIHADPNPGNFLVTGDLQVGLLDFGCVKSFDPSFVDMYRQLIQTGQARERSGYVEILNRMRVTSAHLDKTIREKMVDVFMEMGAWIQMLYKDEEFDFGKNPDYLSQGTRIIRKLHTFRRHFVDCHPDFIFLDRTRYGLIRLFEKMKARLRIQNKYECPQIFKNNL